MGLYITILTDKKCPKCKHKVGEWQSKYIVDKLGYDLGMMQSVKLKDIKKGRMYTICDNCECWILYLIKNGKLKLKETKERK